MKREVYQLVKYSVREARVRKRHRDSSHLAINVERDGGGATQSERSEDGGGGQSASADEAKANAKGSACSSCLFKRLKRRR